MAKKNVLVFETNKKSLSFLKSFFSGSRDYAARFVKDSRALTDSINRDRPEVLIAGSPGGLQEINLPEMDFPLIAVVGGDAPGGLKAVIEQDIEFYIMEPFQKQDLEHKLNMVLNRRDWLRHLLKEKRDLKAILELINLISSTLDPKEVLYFVVKKISEIINVTRCSIISIGMSESRYAHVTSTYEGPELSGIRLDLHKYPEIMRALKYRKPVIVRDALKDPLMKTVRETIKPLGIRSIIVLPIILRDEIIGTLFLRTSRVEHIFTDREIRLCTAIANASANTLHNAFMHEKLRNEKTKLEKLAIIDYLTGVYNIRYFYHRLEEEFSRSLRYNIPLGCIMFDIDHFKKINDLYGHRVGDMVLRELAQLLKRHTRKSDVFARYGGEEFILLLPQTGLNGSLAEAERLRKAVKEYRFRALKRKKGVTISVGISCCPDRRIKTQDDLITYADNALYKAKKMGRDQVVVFSPKLHPAAKHK